MNSHSIRLRDEIRRVLSLLLLLLCVSPALGGVIPGRWEKMDRLPSGTPVIVETRSQGVVMGTLEACDESSLTLRVEGRSSRFPKSEVLTVSMAEKTRGSGSKGALTGAGVGAGALALFGALAGDSADGCKGLGPCFPRGKIAGMGAVVGGVAGALIGFGVAKARSSREVLYRAP
jgi:hypothetical protein